MVFVGSVTIKYNLTVYIYRCFGYFHYSNISITNGLRINFHDMVTTTVPYFHMQFLFHLVRSLLADYFKRMAEIIETITHFALSTAFVANLAKR